MVLDKTINAGFTLNEKTLASLLETSAISAIRMYAKGITYASTTNPMITSLITRVSFFFTCSLRHILKKCFI